MLKGYDCVLEPIDDVLESEIDGQKISERFMDGYEPKSVNRTLLQFQLGDGYDGIGIQRH